MLLSACPGGTSSDGSTTDGTHGTADGTADGSGNETGDGTMSGPGTEGTTAMADSSGGSDDTGEPPVGCGVFPTFEDGAVPTSELHVATDGADTAGCGAPDAPCASVGMAAGQAGPGTAIRIHEGIYAGDEFIGNLAGQTDAPIWIGGAPGEAPPRFEGGSVAFQLSGARYVVIHDLEVWLATANGINVDDNGQYDDPEVTRHLVFRNLSIHDIGQGGNNDCLKLSGVDDFWVTGSSFSRCGGGTAGSGIDMVGCHHGLIAGNTFFDMPDSGNAIQAKGGSDDVEIRANRFDDAGNRTINMGGSTGFEFFRPSLTAGENYEARDIRVVANLMRGSDAPLAFVGCVECSAVHNTIVDPGNWVMRILQETTSTPEYAFAPARDGRFVNNLVYYARGNLSTTVNVGADTAPETFEFANNLWYAHDAPGSSDPGAELPVPETGGVYGEDPMFAELAADDLDVPLSSPAAGAGRDEAASAGGDIEGECYPMPPTIGAWAEGE
ncbi:right-handed parallel beta-helix repeat-containing protein [Paraliomyxa miuraensis]|uniref:right-handed parallel beta-helix repeat-containing protein n=1 Tax=Paraliomyxa miuraensis TaxID=376150 RepID=UPI00224F77B6|nr:right-handed parallel beta-helix repeat-containing protein [Paraliomyxa miuraensis]MCX4246735.1 right-handed parallel beta-helix repeat-containing protein [Paraliomyxa miuraensis]